MTEHLPYPQVEVCQHMLGLGPHVVIEPLKKYITMSLIF